MAATRPHDQCLDHVHRMYAVADVEVHVTTAPPLVNGPYPTAGWRCPHGTTYWAEPTGEQIAQWAKDGVE